MDIEDFKELNLRKGAIIEFDTYPTSGKKRGAQVGYYLDLVEELSEIQRCSMSEVPSLPYMRMADPVLSHNYTPQKVYNIPLKDIANLFLVGQSRYFG